MLPIAAAGAASAASSSGKAAATLMKTVFNVVQNSMQINSLADLTRPARVEPLVIIDQTLVGQPYMLDLMKMAASQFAGYYLQAVNLILGVGRIDTLKVLDQLNPDRSLGIGGSDPTKNMYSGEMFNSNVYSRGLPSMEAFEQRVRPGLLFAMESFDDAKEIQGEVVSRTPNPPAGGKDDKTPVQAGMSSGDTKIYENESLVVGKLLNVELVGKDGAKGKLPVLIRLIPAEVPPNSLVHMFGAGGRDSWAHRFFMVQTGQIGFWKDFVLGQDMIDEHFKALMNDKSGVLKAVTDRRRNNTGKAIQTGRVSLADASNISIVSAETLRKATDKLHGKIEQLSVRKAIFDNSYLLMLIVVDERWDRVTVYHRGLDLESKYRLADVKASEKSKGPDITDLFKMFNKSMQTNV
jgi:hypothetical protein